MRMFRLIVVAILLTPLAVKAQPLADRVPADAIVYVGWQGIDSAGAAYDKSHLKAILNESSFRQLIDDFLPRLIQRIELENGGPIPELRMAQIYGMAMWRHPTAFYFAGVDFPAGGPGGVPPNPRLAFLCQAGADADAVLQELTAMLASMGVANAPFPIKAFKQGDIVALAVGYAQENMALAGGEVKSLAANDNFKQAMAQVGKEPFAVVYGDLEAGLALVDKGIQFENDPQLQMMWPKVRDAIGLGGLKRLVWTAGFDGADWGSQCFLAAPAPRTGLLTMLDCPGVSDDLLKLIPKSATWLGAGRLNLGKLFTEIRTAAGKVDPQMQGMFDQGMGAAQMLLTVNLQTDLFEALGDEWAVYNNPSATGNWMLGMTLVNHLAKPAEAQKALSKIEIVLDNMINGQLQQNNVMLGRKPMAINFNQVEWDGMKIHYLGLPFASPAWAIKDGNLYVALYPQVVSAAGDAAAAQGNSILENPDFQGLRQRLGGQKANGMAFMDLPKTVGQSYQPILMLSQVGLGFAEMFGVKPPPMVIPPLHKIRPHLSPAAGFSWTDDAGWHMKGVSPFPGATMLGSEVGMMMGTAPMAVAVLLPNLNHSREMANRVKSASNLRMIGQGVMLYQIDNKKYPADLGVLVTTADINPEVFVNPSSGKRVPPDIRAGTPDQQAAWVNANSDYIYIGATGSTNDPADTIVAYESHGNGEMPVVNVLYNDGHVDWVPLQVMQQQITQQKAAKAANR